MDIFGCGISKYKIEMVTMIETIRSVFTELGMHRDLISIYRQTIVLLCLEEETARRKTQVNCKPFAVNKHSSGEYKESDL